MASFDSDSFDLNSFGIDSFDLEAPAPTEFPSFLMIPLRWTRFSYLIVLFLL